MQIGTLAHLCVQQVYESGARARGGGKETGMAVSSPCLMACMSRLVASTETPSLPSLSLPWRPRNSTGNCCNKGAATKGSRATAATKASQQVLQQRPPALSAFALLFSPFPSREQMRRGQEAQARRQACLEARDTRRVCVLQARDTRRATPARARGGSKEAGMPVSPPCLVACASLPAPHCSSKAFIKAPRAFIKVPRAPG